MNLQPLSNLDLLPEPDDPNILTAIDNNAIGYSGKEYGISDQDAKKLRRNFTPIKKLLWPWGALMFSLFVTFLIISWPIISPFISSSLPDSEWAFEETGIREMQENGYYGSERMLNGHLLVFQIYLMLINKRFLMIILILI